MLEDRHIIRLQELYQKRFGKELSREEAIRDGPLLLRQVQLLYQPMTVDEYHQVLKRRQELIHKYLK